MHVDFRLSKGDQAAIDSSSQIKPNYPGHSSHVRCEVSDATDTLTR